MKTPIFCGDDLLLAEVPDHTRIIAPPPLAQPAKDPRAVISQALDQPEDSPPLEDLVRPSSRVVIAFDDNALPLPAMRRELRPLALKIILARLKRAGVAEEKISLICAQGLHRKLTPAELARLVGQETFSRFAPDRVNNHDAEDPGGIVEVGRTDQGEVIEINREAAQSDLLIYLNINWTQMNGGWKSVSVGLGTYRTISQHHNPEVLTASRSLMEPHQSAMHQMYGRMGQVLGQKVRCVSLELVIDWRLWWGPWRSMTLAPDAHRVPLLARAAALLPRRAKDLMRQAFSADYRLRAVTFGQVDAVHCRTLALLDQAPCVKVQDQSDTLLLGVVNMSPYAVGGFPNPILVANLGLGYLFNLHQGMPLVKEGGTVIICNPCEARFHPVHHPSYERFFNQALAETTDPETLHRDLESGYAEDPEFRRLYREGHAYHGVHPFFTWYWCCHARAHAGRIIVAGAREPNAVQRLGFESASSVEQAISMAQESSPGPMSLTYPMIPPAFICKVSG